MDYKSIQKSTKFPLSIIVPSPKLQKYENLFISFDNDDTELAAIALKSSLTDIHAVVEGGEYGTPFSLGGHGFYSHNQFLSQASLLKDNERHHAENKFYLSEGEWKTVDHYLEKVAHVSNSIFEKVERGDTLACLAVKKNAFATAALLLEEGVDPLLENEEGADLFLVTKAQYHLLSIRMKEIVKKMVDALHASNTLRQAWEEMDREENVYLTAFEGMLSFLTALKTNLEQRLLTIETDKKIQRRCELLHEAFPPSRLWNIAQEEKIHNYFQEIESLKGYVTEKLFVYRKQQSERKEERLNAKVKNRYVLQILDSPGGKGSRWGSQDDESVTIGKDSLDLLSPTSESGRLDRLIQGEADMGFGMMSSSKEASSSNKWGSRSNRSYKPLLGTLLLSPDTTVSYR
eukprot:scaffold3051_cov167-Ochromonas_danica.AAC.28